ALLRLDPMFDPLRNDPQFQKLVASSAPRRSPLNRNLSNPRPKREIVEAVGLSRSWWRSRSRWRRWRWGWCRWGWFWRARRYHARGLTHSASNVKPSSTFAVLGACTETFSSVEHQSCRCSEYLCHGVQPPEVQKPQVLTGFRAIMIVQHDPPSTIT